MTVLVRCGICGDLVLGTWRTSVRADNVLCPGCLPNMAASLDRLLELDALQVPEEMVRALLAPEPDDAAT